MQANTPIHNIFSSGRAWLESQTAQTKLLRPLMAGAGLVIILALIIATFRLANEQADSLHSAQRELARITKQVNEGSWLDRKQQSETLRFQLYEKFWVAETAGLAEAGLERWLRERVERLGVKPNSVRIQRSPLGKTRDTDAQSAALSGVQRMTAKMVMPFEPDALFQLLNDTASNERIMVVDRMLIRGGRNSLIEIDVSTFVRLAESTQ